MKAVMLEVPEALLKERRRLGDDDFDELWEGVLHMVPLPLSDHQRLGGKLFMVLGPRAEARGLEPFYEIGFFRRADDFRKPDLAFARPEHVTRRGIEGPVPVVFELLSEHDETYEKVPWYLAQGVGEMIVVDPETRRVERYTGAGVDRSPVAIEALGVILETVDGPKLRVAWEGGSAEI